MLCKKVHKVSIPAVDTVSGDINSSLQKSIIDRVPSDPSKTKNLVKVLNLGIGLPAELCLNINIEDGHMELLALFRVLITEFKVVQDAASYGYYLMIMKLGKCTGKSTGIYTTM